MGCSLPFDVVIERTVASAIESDDRLVVDEARSPRCAQGLEYMVNAHSIVW